MLGTDTKAQDNYVVTAKASKGRITSKVGRDQANNTRSLSGLIYSLAGSTQIVYCHDLGQPYSRKVIFGMKPYFNPTRRKMEDDLNILKMEDDLKFFKRKTT